MIAVPRRWLRPCRAVLRAPSWARVGSASLDAEKITELEAPMQLDLSDDDVEMLREVLDSAAERMTSEIRHTDNRVFRQNLKDRRDRLRSLVAVLSGQEHAAGEPGAE